MARNVEIKARVNKIDDLEIRVARISNGDPIEIIQDDTFFTCENGRLKLRTLSEDQGELIFYQRADELGPKECFYVISKTSEPATLREVLTQAYQVVGRVQKRRMLYFKGRTRIHLDRVKELGDFLELEVVLNDAERLEDGMAEARAILSELGIKEAQLVEGAYVDLHRQACSAKQA
ncbi:MAG: class IV adenylate cyclase [Gammaproteobacteria bacterium]